MAKSYPPEAVETCRSLYLTNGGKNYDAIERGMRRAGYSGWTKKNLEDRGERMGWVTRFGFENSLRLHLEKLVESVNNDEQDLYLSIKTLRKRLQVKTLGASPEGKDIQLFRDLARLEIEARRNLDLTRDNLETFAASYELIISWAPDIDPQLAQLLVKNGDRMAELAQLHYGKAEGDDDGAGDSPDAGGDGSNASEDLD